MDLQKPRITEIHVRMDCNGCVQKIKKALHGITGIYDLYIDFPQQKLTIIGWADPEKILKAIKKTRKIATICSHTEQPDPPGHPTEPELQDSSPPQQHEHAPESPETVQTAEPPPPEAPQPLPPENPPPPAHDTNPDRSGHPVVALQANVTYHYQPDPYSYRHNYNQNYDTHWDRYQNHSPMYATNRGYPPSPSRGYPVESMPAPMHPSPRMHQPEASPSHHRGSPTLQPGPAQMHTPMYVTHSYNTHRPSTYVTEYDYVRSPVQQPYCPRYDDYQMSSSNGSGNGNITSIFSDENPNACKIV